ncbi:MAG: hypothetical protein U0Q19_00305 [Kineosporiaceae bacterium]
MELAELTATVERVSEGYADRFGIDRTPDWFLMKLQEELGELTQVPYSAKARREQEA